MLERFGHKSSRTHVANGLCPCGRTRQPKGTRIFKYCCMLCADGYYKKHSLGCALRNREAKP